MSRYLSLEQIAEIHDEMLARFGGSPGIRDHDALQSAVARPASGYYSDVIEGAAALMESLSQNHPFVDGNKRTCITAAAVFLRLNGYKLVFADPEAYNWLIGLYSGGQLRKQNLESWLRAHPVAQ